MIKKLWASHVGGGFEPAQKTDALVTALQTDCDIRFFAISVKSPI